jgi:hypothetical protein
LAAGAGVPDTVIILFDPAFQGLSISLMGGTITSTFLTLLVVPLMYFRLLKKVLNENKRALTPKHQEHLAPTLKDKP